MRGVACLWMLVLAVSLPVAGADAAVSRKKAIWGPIEVAGQSQFPIYEDLGAGIFEYTLYWNAVAPQRPAAATDPADPAYRWPPEIDRALEEGARHGIDVALVVTGSPGWANGGRAPRYAPKRPGDYADFAAAAARRYPGVGHWIIWGEPTKASNFQPLANDRLRPLRGSRLAGPRRYARMLDGAYAAIKGVDRGDLVVGGNSFTVGTVTPLRWIQALKLPDGRPPRMDLYGHNPFSARRPKLSSRPLGHGYADFSDLDELAGWVDRYLGRPRHTRPKLFLAELTLPTGHANYEFNFWLDESVAASWLTSALRIVRGWSRIYTLGYLGLYDDPLRPNGDQVERGLLDREGRRKPAYAAFRAG